MAPPPRTRKAKPPVICCAKPGKGDVQVSVLNIRGPFSSDNLRMPQAGVPASIIPGSVMPPHVATVQIGSYLKKDNVAKRAEAQRMIGHSPGLRPLCVAAGTGSSTLQECLMIRSLHHQKTTPEQ